MTNILTYSKKITKQIIKNWPIQKQILKENNQKIDQQLTDSKNWLKNWTDSKKKLSTIATFRYAFVSFRYVLLRSVTFCSSETYFFKAFWKNMRQTQLRNKSRTPHRQRQCPARHMFPKPLTFSSSKAYFFKAFWKNMRRIQLRNKGKRNERPRRVGGYW